jgi:hypothetical protein
MVTKGSNSSPESATVLTDELSLSDKSLVARVFAPARPKLREVLEVASASDDAAEVWETLAARGVIPSEWMGDGERVFAEDERPPALAERAFNDQPTYAAVQRYLEEGPRLCDVPPTVAAACALASDVQGMTTAERVAREAVRRLAVWGAPQPHRVCWRIVDPDRWETQPGDYRHMPAAIAVGCAFAMTPSAEKNLLRARAHVFGTPAWRASFTWECTAHWRYLARGRAQIAPPRSDVLDRLDSGGYPTIPKPLRGKRFSELENPFEPLLSLWASGYALDAITPSLIVLAAPRIEVSSPKRASRRR